MTESVLFGWLLSFVASSIGRGQVMVPITVAQRIFVGTSGWHYDHWRGPFYPEDLKAPEMLRFYSRKLPSVEVNNSFYRLPTAACFRAWKEQTPSDFLFAVKASRFITHMKKLKHPEEPITRLFSRVSALGRKLGPILFQLPPHWQRNTERFEDFLQSLPKHKYAFEFREPSWFHEDVYRLLRQSNAAFCIYDLAGFQSPRVFTANFTYLRLHGPANQKYAGRYTVEQLRQWLYSCVTSQPAIEQAYIYFDNDQAGFAAINAMEMRELAATGYRE